MNSKQYRENYINIYQEQYNKLLNYILSEFADKDFYYSNGGFKMSRKIALLEQIRLKLESMSDIDDSFISHIEEQYKLNVLEVIEDYKTKSGQDVNLRKEWTKIDDRDVQLIAKDFRNSLNESRSLYYKQISIRINKAWDNENRAFIEKSTAKELENIIVGGDTKKVSIMRLKDKLTNYGMTSYEYVDKNGRPKKINLDTYASIQVNSKVSYLVNKGTVNTLDRLNHDLVQFSHHVTHCPVCGTYAESGGVGLIYSMQQGHSTYRWIGEIPNFLAYYTIHPNCKHRLNAYFPEYAKNNERATKLSKEKLKDNRSELNKKRYDKLQEWNRYNREVKKLDEELKFYKDISNSSLTNSQKRKKKRMEDRRKTLKDRMKKINKNKISYAKIGDL